MTGRRIKQLRISKGMTQEELGQRVGVKKAAVQKWESGLTKNLKRTVIEKLADIFEVKPSYVMGMDEEISVKEEPAPYSIKTKQIPIVGQIAAGTPILAEENVEDYFSIDSRLKADFALTVSGDSMIDAGIFEGDIVFIRQQPSLENGEIGAILVDGEATLKRFFKDNGNVILQSENKSYPPMIYTNGNLKILGKLSAVLNIAE